MKIYPIGLVGESQYQAAIAGCEAGELVRVCHEVGNPHDELALRCETREGTVIGYIARSSWLRRAIHEDGRGCAATIKNIASTENGMLGVVIDVTVTDDLVPERTFSAREEIPQPVLPTSPPQLGDDEIIQTIVAASSLPVTCDCRMLQRVPILGLDETIPIICDRCSRIHHLDADAIEIMEIELLAAVHQMYADAARQAPADEFILSVRRHGEAPKRPIPASMSTDSPRLLPSLKRWLFG